MSPDLKELAPDLETGHPAIDLDHRIILSQLAHLKEALDKGLGREKAVDLIRALQRYTAGHFAREEVHMVRVKCPATERNIAAHREFTNRVEGWLTLLSISSTPVSMLRDIHKDATDWVTAHICGVDCGLRGCAEPNACKDV